MQAFQFDLDFRTMIDRCWLQVDQQCKNEKP
jgi:hypothetical protein